jgi:hypothetical protein
MLCLAVVPTPGALATAAPRLSAPRAETIALAAARLYASATGSITVGREQVGHIGKKLVWLIHLHAPSFRFGCGGADSYCLPSFLGYALVTIVDASGHVLSVRAASS